MCGITAILGLPKSEGLQWVQASVDKIRHRGPDAFGTWSTDGVALGHTRLSILDLSPNGAQPMHSEDDRWVISFNGEIYNHLDIRKALSPAIKWRGHSDTETLVRAISQLGFDEAIRLSSGMFAVVAWDKSNRTLYLARDRMGEKPLYFGFLPNKTFAVASELKALLNQCSKPSVNIDAIAGFLRFGYINGRQSIWQNIFKLQAGQIAEIKPSDTGVCEPTIHAYWKTTPVSQSQRTSSETESLDTLEDLIRSSVISQMQSDVPIGSFLSGGIDSSLITAIMQRNSTKKINTFTIGFEDCKYDESRMAKEVADYLGTNHTTLRVSSGDLLHSINDIPTVWDEPFADESQIPTLALCREARRHVTVALSGDGGDELFGGYDRYRRYQIISRLQKALPRTCLKGLYKSLDWLSISQINWLGHLIGCNQSMLIGDRLSKLRGVMIGGDKASLYTALMSHWDAVPILDYKRSIPAFNLPFWDNSRPNDISNLQYADQLSYLPDDILVKVDRASMAYSLEVRSPLLNHRLVEYSWTLGDNLKRNGTVGKVILRKLLAKYIPNKLVDRPKRGFGIPLATWLRGPLKNWAADLLSENEIKHEGILDHESIAQTWREHQSGQRNWHTKIWCVLMFRIWYARWK